MRGGRCWLFLVSVVVFVSLVAPAAAQQATPTPTASELIGGELFSRLNDVWVRLGIGGILLLIVVSFVVTLTKKAGETVIEYLNRVFLKRRLDKRADALEERDQQRAARQHQQHALDTGTSAYLDWLRDEFKHLPIIPIKSAERPEQLLLHEVYVPLRVVERTQMVAFERLIKGDIDERGELQMRQKAFESLERSQGVYRLLSDAALLPSPPANEGRSRRRSGSNDQEAHQEVTTTRLLLVGDAGSGKTTTLQFGALMLAHDYTQHEQVRSQQRLDLHCPRPLLPFYIRLTLVATYVRDAHERAQPDDLPRLHGAPSSLLLDWLNSYTCEHIPASLPADLPSRLFTQNDCLVMLDGLDETGDEHERAYMQRLIINLVQDYPGNRYLVASRPFADLRLAGFTERHLSPMDVEEMQQLLRNWFGAIAQTTTRRQQERADDQVAYLWGILERNARLFEMATNPLLLTSMALLVHTGVGLPRERAELYHRLTYLLVESWRIEQVTGGVPGKRAPLYGGEESVPGVQRRLQELAAWMQEQQRREIRLSEAQDQLRATYQRLKQWHDEQADDYVCRLLESLALDSGLIQKRDGGYSFAHYTLQEYLTARQYDQRSDGVAGLFAQRTHPRWRETILLAVGHWATQGPTEKAEQLLRDLLGTGTSNDLLLAASALDDADADRVLELAPLRSETIAKLRVLAFDPAACPDPRTRNEAGELLDRLGGDNRPALDFAHPEYWAQRIEPGDFILGDENGEHDDEKPAIPYRIVRPYALARFPVTNRQYFAYLEDLRAQDKREEADKRRPRFWLGSRYRAGEGNHPVVGITWYDAASFADWMDTHLKAQGIISDGDLIRLPTEPEWERAAAYPVQIHDAAREKRIYPWGSEWLSEPDGDTIRANTRESTLNGTSVVGLFPHGAAACGAEDLASNVFEWCSTRRYDYADYPPPEMLVAAVHDISEQQENRLYMLRGGAWNLYSSFARCGYRFAVNAVNHDGSSGVRIARLFSS
jgi:formylglycine-generating enzyme required for sulfatase activity